MVAFGCELFLRVSSLFYDSREMQFCLSFYLTQFPASLLLRILLRPLVDEAIESVLAIHRDPV
jgi:hypothetical protein